MDILFDLCPFDIGIGESEPEVWTTEINRIIKMQGCQEGTPREVNDDSMSMVLRML